ncbi:isochorismatase family protein [Teredinibacter purpureus]|uniref:isochorismatase family protein n=1 Tax=Teredinibacter purpureus TaxID=2731756 RepID=UPI0005F7981E|nr:isochorismatase family protein [Teredinibacter purpureus]
MTIPALNHYALPSAQSLPKNKVNWTLDHSRAVLLIHDMQDYFVDFYGTDNPLMTRVIDNINAIRSHCDERGIPVVYTAQQPDENHSSRGLLNDMWGAGINNRPERTPIVSLLAPKASDTTLVKHRYSAFQKSDLESRMRRWGRDQLIIVGIYGHIGCQLTAADAFMRDIQPFMVADGIADFSAVHHQKAIEYVASCCGKVVSCDALKETLTAKKSTIGNAKMLTRNDLLNTILGLIDEPEEAFDSSESLMDYGLDSVQVMAFISEWRAGGIDIQFTDLAENTSFDAWWALLEKKQSSNTLEGSIS